MRIICIGIGNTLYGDDGIGEAIINGLENLNLDIELYRGGVGGLGIVYEMEDFDTAIIVDAIADYGDPGLIYRLEDDEYLSDEDCAVTSVHDSGLAKGILLIQSLELIKIPKKLIFYGIQSDSKNFTDGKLSETAKESIPKVVNLIKKEVEELQKV